VPDIDQRDPDEVAAVLTRWLATKSDHAAGPEVFDVQAPASNGFSNETILCRTRSSDGEERRLVVRVAPTKHLLFMDADFSTQYRVMRTLTEGGTGIPLPTLGWYEEDPQYLGVPFFTMDHVDGEVPADNLPTSTAPTGGGSGCSGSLTPAAAVLGSSNRCPTTETSSIGPRVAFGFPLLSPPGGGWPTTVLPKRARWC
jgi:aminoglycoside phosphotransferase (APT) family kinase protein